MSRWNRFGWYVRAAKKAPPEHGIKMKKVGATWWGQRWIEALQNVLRGDSARLGRGHAYARSGRVHDLVINGGKVAAKVTGSRSSPYKIRIELAQLPDSVWKKAIAGMAAKAQFSAELLSGQMPKEVDEVFRAAGTSLFPEQPTDLSTGCSCPDWGDPCKHVAAAHYLLGEALDRDPFLLFELRGRTKAEVLDALQATRGGEDAPTKKQHRANAEADSGERIEIPRVALGKIKAADYDRTRVAFPELHFSFDAPVVHGAVLRQLGIPNAWSGTSSPADALSPLVRTAAEAARRIALAEFALPECERGAPVKRCHPKQRQRQPKPKRSKGKMTKSPSVI
jgi:uncharacterized Zn finger protein